MDPRRIIRMILAVFAGIASTFAAVCVFIDPTYMNPIDLVNVGVGGLPHGVASVFILYGDGGRVQIMDEYEGKVFYDTYDPVALFRERFMERPMRLVIEHPVIPARWVDSRRYGILTYTMSRDWKLWWISEANIRRPPAPKYFGDARRAEITLTDEDAAPVSKAEAMHLLGLADRPE